MTTRTYARPRTPEQARTWSLLDCGHIARVEAACGTSLRCPQLCGHKHVIDDVDVGTTSDPTAPPDPTEPSANPEDTSVTTRQVPNDTIATATCVCGKSIEQRSTLIWRHAGSDRAECYADPPMARPAAGTIVQLAGLNDRVDVTRDQACDMLGRRVVVGAYDVDIDGDLTDVGEAHLFLTDGSELLSIAFEDIQSFRPAAAGESR